MPELYRQELLKVMRLDENLISFDYLEENESETEIEND